MGWLELAGWDTGSQRMMMGGLSPTPMPSALRHDELRRPSHCNALSFIPPFHCESDELRSALTHFTSSSSSLAVCPEERSQLGHAFALPGLTSCPLPPWPAPSSYTIHHFDNHTASMAPKNKAEVVESKTPAEFFSEHQSICGFDNVSLRGAKGVRRAGE